MPETPGNDDVLKVYDPARVSHLSGSQATSATPPGCRTHCQTGMCDTLAGSLKALLCDPQGVEGVGKGLCTSVTASRMTDAYGASTLRVPHG